MTTFLEFVENWMDLDVQSLNDDQLDALSEMMIDGMSECREERIRRERIKRNAKAQEMFCKICVSKKCEAKHDPNCKKLQGFLKLLD